MRVAGFSLSQAIFPTGLSEKAFVKWVNTTFVAASSAATGLPYNEKALRTILKSYPPNAFLPLENLALAGELLGEKTVQFSFLNFLTNCDGLPRQARDKRQMYLDTVEIDGFCRRFDVCLRLAGCREGSCHRRRVACSEHQEQPPGSFRLPLRRVACLGMRSVSGAKRHCLRHLL